MRVIAHGFARSPIIPVDSELSGWHPVDLAAAVVLEALGRAQLSASLVDEIIVACAEPVGAQGGGVARAVALAAGLPGAVSGFVVDRGETSGAGALHTAADMMRAGRWSRVLVVGIGMASTVPPGASALNRTFGAPWGPAVAARLEESGGVLPGPRAAEVAVTELGLGRADLDAWAERSRARRQTAPPSPSIVSVGARPGDSSPLVRPGDPVSADTVRDWGPTEELPPAFESDGVTTAASFAPPADSVAALVLELAEDSTGPSGSEPVVSGTSLELLGSGRAAGEPLDPTGNVTAAVYRALGDAEVAITDVDAIEVVETSAAAVILVARALGLSDSDRDRLNRHGGALATGDAGAAEELRVVADAGGWLEAGRLLLTVSAGASGSAATVWRGVSGSSGGRGPMRR